MLLWFVGMAPLLVWAVFQSPALDYRVVVLGAVLPLADALTGGPWLLHTLLAPVTALAVVMLTTRRRRLARRRWLGVPIGMFLHLVLDGTWTDTQQFWWPLFGSAFTNGPLPELGRGRLGVVLELAGIAALVFLWRRFDLGDPVHRDRFVRTGQLPRART